jgi:hypothetical protein
MERHRLNAEVEDLIERFEEATVLGSDAEGARAFAEAGNMKGAVALWRHQDDRLCMTELGRLMTQRHELQEKLRDKSDDADAAPTQARK